ncbi:hypothetical protein ABPG72_002746 [Tetrahymena utriculariae]
MGNCVQTSQHNQLQQEVKQFLLEKGFTISGQIVAKIKDINRVIIATKNSRQVAFKVRYFQSKLQLKEYQDQANILQRVVHPNVVQFEEHFNSNHVFFMQMEYCPNNLRQLLKEKNLNQQEQFHYAMQVIRGVQAIHSANHSHKELKTQNILVNQQGNLVIGDFGLDKEDDIFYQKCQCQDDLVNSQRWYVAPEIQMGQPGILQNINQPADIWSLGIIILEIFGLKYVSNFCSIEQLQQTLDLLYNQDFAFLNFIDKFLIDIIKQLLNSEPSKRPGIDKVKKLFQKEIDVRFVVSRSQTDDSDDFPTDSSFQNHKIFEVNPPELQCFLNGQRKQDDSIKRLQILFGQHHQTELYMLIQQMVNMPQEVSELNLTFQDLQIDSNSVRELILQTKSLPVTLSNIMFCFRNVTTTCDQSDFYQNLITKIPDKIKYIGLYIEKQSLNKKMLKDLASSLKFLPPKIKSLALGFYQNIFSNDSFRYFSLILDLLPQNLKSFELNIENNPDISTKGYMTMFQNIGSLPVQINTLYLSLKSNSLNEESIEVLCLSLKKLHNQISQLKIDLSKSINDSISFTRFCFHLPQIIGTHIAKICLYFEKCNIADEDINKLCDSLLKAQNHLTQIEIGLQQNLISNIGFHKLIQFVNANKKAKLANLYLGNNKKIKEEDVIQMLLKIKDQIPNNYARVGFNFGENYLIRQGLIEGENYQDLENEIIKINNILYIIA